MAFNSATSFTTTQAAVLVAMVMAFSSFQVMMLVSSFEFQVGDNMGWVVPPVNDTKFFNDWASEKRFRAGDAIRFKYKKDSVMEVSEAEYKKCNSTLPNFFSNTGNTMFKLERSGYFYFISGASGHCERGQRMIVKVMAQDRDDSTPTDSDASSAPTSATLFPPQALAFVTALQFAFLYLFSYLF